MSIVVHRRIKCPVLTNALVQQVWRATRRYTDLSTDFALGVVVVGDKTMQRWNTQYRGVHQVTDVLSFPYSANSGDIVICYTQAKRQALGKQVSLRSELAWLLTHGLLHLLGYDHERPADAKVMRPLEQTILRYV